MLKETKTGILEVEEFEGQVLLGISSENCAISCLLNPEDAQELSSFLFQVYVGLIGIKTTN